MLRSSNGSRKLINTNKDLMKQVGISAQALLRRRTWVSAIVQAGVIFAALFFAWLLRFEFTLPQKGHQFRSIKIHGVRQDGHPQKVAAKTNLICTELRGLGHPARGRAAVEQRLGPAQSAVSWRMSSSSAA